MANPQLEKGYMKIANEITDALCAIRIPGEAYQILNVILRKTYGYNKKEDRIALSQFMDMTKLKKVSVCKAIEKLRTMNIIVVTQNGNDYVKTYKINKDFDSWVPLPKKVMKPRFYYPKRVLQNT